jgi:deoxycytidine triphosphate deaminase
MTDTITQILFGEGIYMILSDKNLEEQLITDPSLSETAKKWWEEEQWKQIGRSIVIKPYERNNLSVCSYDLCVGHEYISVRNPREINPLAHRERLNVSAGETVLIITKEYVCLPKNVMAVVVPSARYLFEGTSIAACRIEPTWYGSLTIPFTNFTKSTIWLLEGQPFCTCFFMETNEVSHTLKELGVRNLGREDLQDLTFEHLLPEEILAADQVTLGALDQVVGEYGKPWDIIRGAFSRTKDEIQHYIVEDTAPNITRQATNNAVRHAFRRLEYQLWALIAILGTALLAGVGGLIWNLVH